MLQCLPNSDFFLGKLPKASDEVAMNYSSIFDRHCELSVQSSIDIHILFLEAPGTTRNMQIRIFCTFSLYNKHSENKNYDY